MKTLILPAWVGTTPDTVAELRRSVGLLLISVCDLFKPRSLPVLPLLVMLRFGPGRHEDSGLSG